MPALLSQEWLDVQRASTRDLPPRPGASAVIEYRITGGADGDVVFHTVFEDGRIVENALGAASDPDFTMTMPITEFERVACGELDQDVGFMQGRIKVAGNIGRLLSVLPVTTSDEWRSVAAEVWADTHR